MFPNPQDALPLPDRPNLVHCNDVVAGLVEASRSGDAHALAAVVDGWIGTLSWAATAGHERAGHQSPDRAAGQIEEFARRRLTAGCGLADAQAVVARAHGFAEWARFAGLIERLSRGGDAFEAAADAVVAGDEAGLSALLAADARLVRARSERAHAGTLLIYTSANGVEAHRQRTPANVVRVAALLLDAGGAVDATADVYGGACTTLGLAATSAHPRAAGVQIPLLDLLLARGARMENGIAGGDAGAVLACLGNGCPQAAAFLAERGARVHLVEAAGLGRRDAVERFLERGEATAAQLNEALRWACLYGRTAVGELLVRRGADLGATSPDGQTPAHMAVIGGHLATLTMLLTHGPPLEQRNAYGGTVLGQTLWSAGHGGDPDRTIAILEALLSAGASLPDSHVPVNARLDAFLETRGSLPEPAWHWFGEKPRS